MHFLKTQLVARFNSRSWPRHLLRRSTSIMSDGAGCPPIGKLGEDNGSGRVKRDTWPTLCNMLSNSVWLSPTRNKSLLGLRAKQDFARLVSVAVAVFLKTGKPFKPNLR